MKKKILSLVLCLALCLALIPATAVLAADVDYNVWINGEQFTSSKLTITCGTGTATYDPTTGVLTLNNAQIVGSGSGKGIESKEIITISLTGENTIKNFDDGINSNVAEVSTLIDTLSIVGTGKLSMTNVLGGILVNRGGLAITDSVTVEITSTKPSAPAAGLYVRSGALTIDSDSTVNITSAYTGAHVGYNVRIADNASVNITAANSGYGIKSDMYGIVFLDNVTVTIQSSSHGVYTLDNGKVEISGGAIDIESENKIAIKAHDDIIVDTKCEMLTPENGEFVAMTTGEHAGYTIVLDGENPAKHVVFALKCTHENTEIRNAVKATCTEDGYTGDTYCVDCEKMITAGTTAVKTGHTEAIDEAVAATCTTAGKTAGKHCSVCKAVIVEQETITAKGHVDLNLDGKCDSCGSDMSVSYDVTYAAGKEWTNGTEEVLVFVSNAEFTTFQCVKIDGEVIAATNYDASSGSTKIALKASYLKTLTAGNHTIEIVSSNGSATGTFAIKAAQADESQAPSNPNSTNPTGSGTDDVATGVADSSAWLIVLFASLGALTTALVSVMKKSEKMN